METVRTPAQQKAYDRWKKEHQQKPPRERLKKPKKHKETLTKGERKTLAKYESLFTRCSVHALRG